MAISRSQLVKELEPGLNALILAWNIVDMKISMLKFILLKHLTELLKRK